VDFYHAALASDPAARQLLSAAGLNLAEAVTVHRLGFSNRTLGAALAATPEGRALRVRLQSLGVFRADSGHEHLNGCLVFPLADSAGQVVQLCGYRLAQTAAPRTLLLPGAERGIFNVGELKAGGDWLLCGSPLDALALWCHGHNQVTAIGSELNADMRVNEQIKLTHYRA
jgi:DNA primase